MKSCKKLKLTLMILICVLIILIGIVGIYQKKGNSYKDVMPKYNLSSDLEGSTVLEFEVDKGTNTIYLDKDGKEVDSSEVTEKNEKDYTKKEVLVNEEESLNLDNYKKVVKIMKERLKFLRADQYRIDLDEKTGKIVLTYSDDYPEDIKSILPMEAKMELIDVNTEEIILDYNDFVSAEATYAALDPMAETPSYAIYINLKLNDSGIEKINNIDKYKTTNNEESEEKETTNSFKVMFDTDEIAEVSYDDILLVNNKILRICTDNNLTTDSAINSALNTNTIVSKLATMGRMPVIYNIEAEEYIKSNAVNYIDYIIIGMIAICAVISIYFVIKYKSKGILAVIAFVANISLFLILIRLTNIQISLNGLAGILGLIVLNTILVNNMLKAIKEEKTFSENIKNAYLRTIDAFVAVLIIFAVFAFSSMAVINSMGLLVFWGWLVILLGNLMLTVPMLAIVDKK